MSPLREVLDGRSDEELLGLNFQEHFGDEDILVDSQPETVFDQIVGAIEDIVIDDGFQELQNDILEKYFHHFDVGILTVYFYVKIKAIVFQSSEENKLIYTNIYNEYTAEIEKYIETELVQVNMKKKNYLMAFVGYKS